MDTLQRWLEECCIADPKAITPFKELYDSYGEWCKENEEIPMTKRKFGDKLSEKGFLPVVLPKHQKGRRGLHLKEGPTNPGTDATENPTFSSNSIDSEENAEKPVTSVTHSGDQDKAVTDVTDCTDFPYFSPISPSIEKNMESMVQSVTSVTQPLDNPPPLGDTSPESDSPPQESKPPLEDDCPVCAHPQRDKIEYLFECGISAQYLSQKYGVPVGAIYSHGAKHIPPRKDNPKGGDFDEILLD
jgi:hypothetical protein